MSKLKFVLLIFLTFLFFCTSIRAIITYGTPQDYKGFKTLKGNLSFNDIKSDLFSNEHMGKLRYIYNSRLRNSMGLKGIFCVTLAIHNSGQLLEVTYNSSTLNDSLLISNFLGEISSWKFNMISSGNDTTIIYVPFVFSQ
jgi:hypothetical protein